MNLDNIFDYYTLNLEEVKYKSLLFAVRKFLRLNASTIVTKEKFLDLELETIQFMLPLLFWQRTISQCMETIQQWIEKDVNNRKQHGFTLI